MSNYGWIAPIVLVGLCAICLVWTLATAPGFHVKDKHVFITGATKGLGLATAKRYAKGGAKLTLVGRSMDRLQAAHAAIEAAVSSTVAICLVQADITVYEEVQRAIEEANRHHGQPTDQLVCAATASTTKRGFVVDSCVESIHSLMEINYFSVIHVVKSALPAMIEAQVRGARVVLVSSTEAFHAAADAALASGSMFALKGLADSLRNEFKLYGMGVHIFHPGSHQPAYPALRPATKGDAPATPAPGSDAASATDYATFDESGSTGITSSDAHFDALAKNLTDGVGAGHVSITNSVSGFMLRGLSNGVTTRTNSMFELMVLPLAMIYYGIATLFTQTPSVAHQDAAQARAANVDNTNL